METNPNNQNAPSEQPIPETPVERKAPPVRQPEPDFIPDEPAQDKPPVEAPAPVQPEEEDKPF